MAAEQNRQKENKSETTATSGAGSSADKTAGEMTIGAQNAQSGNKSENSAQQIASQVGEVLRGNKSAAKGILSQAKGSTGRVASEAFGQVQEKASTKLDEKKSDLAQGLGSVAESIRQMGENLKGTGEQSGVVSLTAQYGDTLARQVEEFSGYLEKHNVSELMRDVERFARRNPSVFIGGAFVLGLLGARFLKSSSPNQALIAVERDNRDELNRIKSSDRQTNRSSTSKSDASMRESAGDAKGEDTKTSGSSEDARQF